MSSLRKREKQLGLTGFADTPLVMAPVTAPIAFPDKAIRKRVVVERPAPPPVRRTCPYCGALFDDYTKRHNTIYCRASCRVAMSLHKRKTAIKQLAGLSNVPEDKIADICDVNGLPYVEQLLNQFGYQFQIEHKAWRKA